MERLEDIVGEFVERSDETKKLGQGRTDGDGEDGVPDEEFVFGGFGDTAFLPGDFGMQNIRKNGGDSGGD